MEFRWILRRASADCSDRCLVQSSKWASQLLLGCSTTSSNIRSDDAGISFLDDIDKQHHHHQQQLQDEEADIFNLAKYYFQSREFDRAAHLLKSSSSSCTSPQSTFLRLYSKYLAGEKRADESDLGSSAGGDHASSIEAESQTSSSFLNNPALQELDEELSHIYKQQSKMDGFLLYLYGVVAAKQVDKTRAIHLLIESVNKYPYNWSAWLELASCLSSQDMVSQIKEKLPANSFMTSFFMVHIGLEIHSDLDAVESRLADLMKIFPDSIYLQSQIALAKYNNREFEDAAAEFEEIIKKDPFNLDQMDIYSNTLYVMEKKAELSFLAHSCALVDRYRPETCLVIGNYYSMRGDHAKAVMYYQRALKLNRHFLAAWTLMGHEYVEMKNTPAAIEAYRRAIDIKPVDYRAWYGLGQTYEVLNMPFYSLYYYQRAASLRPWDSRMWIALAGNFEKLKRDLEAIKSYKRALLGLDENDLAGPTLFCLGGLYDKLSVSSSKSNQRDKSSAMASTHRDSAAFYFKLAVAEGIAKQSLSSQEMDHGYLYLGAYFKDKGQLSEAEMFLRPVDHLEEGKSLIKQINDLRQRRYDL